MSKQDEKTTTKKAPRDEDANAIPRDQERGGVNMQRDNPVNATEENKRVVQNLSGDAEPNPDLNIDPDELRKREADGATQEKKLGITADALEAQKKAEEEAEKRRQEQQKAAPKKLTDKELTELGRSIDGKIVVVFENPQAFRRFFREEMNVTVTDETGETSEGTIVARSGHEFTLRGPQNAVKRFEATKVRKVIVR